MKNVLIYLSLPIIPLLIAATRSTADLLPFHWSLLSTVQQSDANGNTVQSAERIDTVQNPLVVSQSAILPPSFSTTGYNINIAQTMADYWIAVDQSCRNQMNAAPICLSNGRIELTAMTDIQVNVDMAYQYYMPSDLMDVDIYFDGTRLNPTTFLFSIGRSDDTDLSGPHGGNFSINHSFIIPAGQSYRLSYGFELRYSVGALNNVTGTGNGSLHMTMTALPEPATLALLAGAAIPLIRRRRR